MNRSQNKRRAEDAAIRWLVRLNSPDLSASQEAEFFSWLNMSASHQAAYIKAEQFWQRGSALQYLEEKKAPQKAITQWAWAGACACVLVVVASVAFFRAQPPQAHFFQTAIGEQQEFLLDDGTRITLNTNSHVRVELNTKHRAVFLEKGEVFFAVRSDKNRPFDVITSAGVVRVLGTRFAVHAQNNDAVVTVVEGKVGLAPNFAADSGFDSAFTPAVTLTADQQMHLQAAAAGAAPQTIDAERELSWRNRQLIYRGEPLPKVVDDLNRYFPEKIVLIDPALRQMEVSAVIQLTDRTTTIGALAQALDLHVSFNEAAKTVELRAH